MTLAWVERYWDLLVGLWCALGFSLWYFYQRRGHNAVLKRRVHPWLMGLGAVLFLALIVAMTPLAAIGSVLPLAIGGVMFVTYLNVRLTRFCDVCGSAIYTRPFIQPARFCRRCGALLAPGASGLGRPGGG